MDLMAAGCQLTPNADSLETRFAGPSSSQPFSILNIIYHVRQEMSNVFLYGMKKIHFAENQTLTNPAVCG